MKKITDLASPGPGPAMVIHHINGDRLDNSPENLAMIAAPRSCRRCGGPISQGGCVRSLTPPDICALCELTEKSAAVVELAKMARALEPGE